MKEKIVLIALLFSICCICCRCNSIKDPVGPNFTEEEQLLTENHDFHVSGSDVNHNFHVSGSGTNTTPTFHISGNE